MVLPYELELIQEIAHQSSLTVLGNGLGAHDILIELCRIYAEANLFVIVLNSSPEEQRYCFDKLKLRKDHPTEIAAKKLKTDNVPSNEAVIFSRMRYISSQFGTAADRKQAYALGGVFFMSTAPLVILDLINGVIPAHLVSGVVIPSAHQLVNTLDTNDSAPISLAVRLLLEQNPGVFVTALTDRPGAVAGDSSGSGLSRLATNLMIDRILLRPRFEASVKKSFKESVDEGKNEKSTGENENSSFRITQIDVNLNESMSACHSALLQLCALCSRELRSALGSVSCLQRPDTISNPQLAISQMPIVRTSKKASLETEMEAIRLAKAVSRGGAWSLLPQKARNLAEDVTVLRSMVACLFRDNPYIFYNKIMSFTGDPNRRVAAGSSGWIGHPETVLLEKATKERSEKEPVSPLPLWKSLEDIFEEVRQFSSDKETMYAIVGYDESHVIQLSSVLKYGPKQYMEMEKEKFLEKQRIEKQEFNKKRFKPRKRRVGNGDDIGNLEYEGQREIAWIRMKDSYLSRLEQLDAFFSHTGPFADRLNRVIILCANSVTLMRQIEKMCTSADDRYRFQIYWLSHRDTLEERDYLAALSSEVSAFSRLANDRASLAVSRDLLLSNARAVREEREESDGSNKVLVDVRELRSQLPGALHMRGLEIVPQTLTIADYIVTPDCGIERKALPDLISSIFSGRLYTQCTALTAAYSKPVLLIELPSNTMSSFNSSVSSWNVVLPRHTALAEVRSSLVLLILRFPKLRLVWSPNPDASAQLFIQLKQFQPDPNVTSNMSTVGEDEEDGGSQLVRIFEHLPILSSRQARCLANRVSGLNDLAQKSKNGQLSAPDGSIAKAIGPAAARQLSDFLNTDLSAAAAAAN